MTKRAFGKIMKHGPVALMLLVFSVCPSAGAGQPLVLGNTTQAPLVMSGGKGALDLIAKEAFGKIGVEVLIETLPAERSLISANEGLTDGELIRLGGIGKLYPHLLPVPEKLMDIRFVGFSRHVDIRTEGWDSLKPYHVGFVRGWKILEKNVKAASVTKVKNPDLLFTLLGKDRADIVIYHQTQGYGMVDKLDLKDVRVLDPPLLVKETFLYLHKKHGDLIPRLAAALREMKADGSYDRIFRETLAPFLKQVKSSSAR